MEWQEFELRVRNLLDQEGLTKHASDWISEQARFSFARCMDAIRLVGSPPLSGDASAAVLVEIVTLVIRLHASGVGGEPPTPGDVRRRFVVLKGGKSDDQSGA